MTLQTVEVAIFKGKWTLTRQNILVTAIDGRSTRYSIFINNVEVRIPSAGRIEISAIEEPPALTAGGLVVQ